MLGSSLDAVYPVVPLSERHALSIGMVTVSGRACFGIYADRGALPDAHLLAGDVDFALEELLARAERRPVDAARPRLASVPDTLSDTPRLHVVEHVETSPPASPPNWDTRAPEGLLPGPGGREQTAGRRAPLHVVPPRAEGHVRASR